MTNQKRRKCAHVPCLCDVPTAEEYCGEGCRDAGSEDLKITCQCYHNACPLTFRQSMRGDDEAGAVEFLTRPLSDQELLDSVQFALERDRARRQRDAEIATLRERFESLSPREHEVVVMVVSGMLNKQIAAEIGTTENAVKVHRSRAMEKMQAKSVPHLVKMVERLQIAPEK